MAIVIGETAEELGIEEKLIALKILMVIYLYDKRYGEALRDIEELLNDPRIQEQREYLLLKQNEVRQVLASLADKKKGNLLKLFKITFSVF